MSKYQNYWPESLFYPCFLFIAEDSYRQPYSFGRKLFDNMFVLSLPKTFKGEFGYLQPNTFYWINFSGLIKVNHEHG